LNKISTAFKLHSKNVGVLENKQFSKANYPRLDHIYSCFQENLKELESSFYYIKVLFSRVLGNSIFLV
jgi:hypothetical protein